MTVLISFVIGFSAAVLLVPSPVVLRYKNKPHVVADALFGKRKRGVERFARWLEKRYVGLSVYQYLAGCLFFGLVNYAFTFLILNSWWLSLPAVCTGILFCERLIAWQRAKRIERFEAGNIRALRIMASSLRTSPSYLHAFQQVASHPYVPADVRREYGRIVDMVHAQMPLELALRDVQKRTGSADLGQLATILLVQRDCGGDIAKTLDVAASAILRRKQLERRQRVALSQLLAQVNLLSFMPFLFVAVLYLNNPQHFSPLTETLGGRLAVLGCFVTILLGGELIRYLALRPFHQKGEG